MQGSEINTAIKLKKRRRFTVPVLTHGGWCLSSKYDAVEVGNRALVWFGPIFKAEVVLSSASSPLSKPEISAAGAGKMDIISQLQEQVDAIALLAVNAIGTLQRDAPPVRLSPNYPEPQANPPEDFAEQPKVLSAVLVKAAKQFDALVAALPLAEGGEESQLRRIAELQAENDVIGQELQKQLEAAEKELKQVQELFSQATDNCLNLKKPD